MSDLDLFAQPGDSPFDAIRRSDDAGEWWSARDLQPRLEYDSWRRLEDAIERARISCGNAGHDADQHLCRTRQDRGSSPNGYVRDDFRLTRFGAYLLAMNGDVRKSAVAAAQTYFAVKTREAEVAVPAPREALPDISTPAGVLVLAEQFAATARQLVAATAALESAAPAIAFHDRYVSADDVLTVKAWAAQFGLTDPQARALLIERNIIYRMSIGMRWSSSKRRLVEEFEYRARASRATFGWFDLRPQHDAPRHHNGQVRQTLYVRQQHALALGAKVGLTSQLPDGDVARADGQDGAA